MPIKNFVPDTDNVPLWQALPEIARLRKGIRPDPNGAPVDLDYFRVDFNEAFAGLEPKFVELYGEKPTVFHDVEMFGDTVDEVFSMDMEQYNTSGTLIRRCDRETKSRWYDEKSGYHMTARTPCDSTWSKEANSQRTQKRCDCEERGKLSIVLRDFADETQIYGYFLVQTGSIHDLTNIWAALTFWSRKLKTYHIPMSSVTFTLGRANDQISAPLIDKKTKERTGKRINVTKSLFYLYTDREQIAKARELAYERDMLAAPAIQLPSGDVREKVHSIFQQRRMGDPLKFTPIERTDPQTDGRLVKPEPKPEVVDGTFDEGTAGTVEPESSDPKPELEIINTQTFISERIKYIAAPGSNYVAFARPDDALPARLYGRDLLRELGEPFTTFANELTPGPATQDPISLPESLTVTAVEKVSGGGVTYYLVTKLERVEAAEDAPEQKAKAS